MSKVLVGRLLASVMILPLACMGVVSAYTKYYTVTGTAFIGAIWGVLMLLVLWGVMCYMMKDLFGE